jgi:hypothetical protein
LTDDTLTISPGPRFKTAMILAVIADALQILVFPSFVEGALSPADDILDFGIAALLINLLGWHWEFLPSFLAKLVPGVDLVPFWTMAVINVYRKSKRIAVEEEIRQQHPALEANAGSISRGLFRGFGGVWTRTTDLQNSAAEHSRSVYTTSSIQIA